MVSIVQNSNMNVVLKATELTRSFAALKAVNGVNLELESGTITGLIGPNGAGKTTLMLMLAGMLAPDSGTISVAGVDFASHPREARARIGWLPDTFGSWGDLKVREIMNHFAALYGLGKIDAQARTEELLQTVHLSELADRQAHILSRGQKQRLGVARTLINRPQVLVLDEPAAGMDPRSRIELRELLRREAARGTAVLISSHVLSELENMVDTAVFMKAGKVANTHPVTPDTAEESHLYRLEVLDDTPVHAYLGGANTLNLTQVSPLTWHLEAQSASDASAALAQLTAAGVSVHSFGMCRKTTSLEEIYIQVDEGKADE